MAFEIKGQTKAAVAFKGNFGDYGLTPSLEKKGGRYKIEIGHQGALYFIIFENQGGLSHFGKMLNKTGSRMRAAEGAKRP